MYRWIGRLTRNSRRLRRIRFWALLMPRRLVFSLVTLTGRVIYMLASRTRRTIIGNMEQLMPHVGRRERRSMCRRYIVHECLTIYEQAIEYPRALTGGGAAFRFEGRQHLDEALSHGRGAIVFTPHVGNYFYSYWELSRHYHCQTVATAGSADLRPLFEGLYGLGLNALDYDNEPPLDLIRKLRSHLSENGVLFLLGDFWRPGFPDSTLFGKPSKIPAGAATLALLRNVPVIPFHGRREGWFGHGMVFEQPLYLVDKYGVDRKAEAMDELSRVLEELIRKAPQQWLYWFNVHERWEAGQAEEGGFPG